MAPAESGKSGIDAWTVSEYRPNFLCPFDNPEAAGYVLAGSLPIGVVIMGNVFFSAAILEMASRAAGCGYLYDTDVDDDDDVEPCKGTVMGLRPANIYILVTSASAIVVAIIIPLIGAIVDHTRFRKSLAAGSLLVLALISFIQVGLNRSNWMFMTVLQIPAIAAYMISIVASSAYLPELSNVQSELNTAGSFATLYLFVTEVTFTLLVTGVGIALFGTEDNVNLCRLSLAVTGCVLLYTCVHVYGRLLSSRPKEKIAIGLALREGVGSLRDTFKEISVKYPMVRRYLAGVMFADAAMSAFPAVSATFLVTQLGASGSELALVILALLIVGAVVSPIADKTSKWCGRRWGDSLSGWPPLCASLIFLCMVTVAAPLTLRKPSDYPKAFIFAVLWGIGMGFYYSLMKPVFFYIVPGGQEAKFSGVFTFCQAILNWAPLLAFSIAYSLTDSLVGGFVIMACFMACGAACLLSVDMNEARAAVENSGTLELRTAAVESGGLAKAVHPRTTSIDAAPN